jgi:hypothetical protein
MNYSIPVFSRPFLIPGNVDNAVIEIAIRETGEFEDFKAVRPVTRESALKELKRIRAAYPQDRFRLRLEDWGGAVPNEIIE